MLQFPDFPRPKLLSRSDSVENCRFMSTCDFFSSTNHYQSHAQSFGKVLGVCYELRCARMCNGSQIETEMEMILQESRSVRRKQHKVHFSVRVLVVLAQDARIHFF